MAYTEKEYKYYLKNPKQITADLDEDLLLALVDVNSSWFSYMKPHTLDMVKKAIDIDPTTFKYADRTVFTSQYLEEVISQYPFLIQYVYNPSDDLIKVALTKDSNVLQYLKRLPVDILTWIVGQNGLALEHIPAAEQTMDIVRIAVTENIDAYKYSHIKNLELDLIVLEKDPTRIDIISDYHPELIDYIIDYNPRYITKFLDYPDNIVTDELKRKAIALDPEVYKLIPNPNLELSKFAALIDLSLMDHIEYSQELIDYVIEYNGLALQYVKKKDLRTIRKAIEQNVLALQFVKYPRQFLIDYAFELDALALQFIENPTEEQCLNAVKRNGLALRFIENPTKEQCLEAVKNDGYAIEFIPANKQTKTIQTYALSSIGVFAIPYITNPADEDIILEMIRKEPAYIFKIDEPTDAMIVTAFSSAGQLILFYDKWEEKFNNVIIEAALKSDGTILEKVESKTKRMIMAALESFPSALQWVREQDLEMAKFAVNLDVSVLYFVDPAIMDEELLTLAISIDPDFFTRINGEMTYEQWITLQGQGN